MARIDNCNTVSSSLETINEHQLTANRDLICRYFDIRRTLLHIPCFIWLTSICNTWVNDHVLHFHNRANLQYCCLFSVKIYYIIHFEFIINIGKNSINFDNTNNKCWLLKFYIRCNKLYLKQRSKYICELNLTSFFEKPNVYILCQVQTPSKQIFIDL